MTDTTMRANVLHAKETVSVDDVPVPTLDADQVLVRIEAVGVCGSDVHAYEWTDGYGFMEPHLPVVMGHEIAGRIARTGTGSGFEAGARVCVIPFVACGACPECRADQTRDCTRRGTIGLTRDGGLDGVTFVGEAQQRRFLRFRQTRRREPTRPGRVVRMPVAPLAVD